MEQQTPVKSVKTEHGIVRLAEPHEIRIPSTAAIEEAKKRKEKFLAENPGKTIEYVLPFLKHFRKTANS